MTKISLFILCLVVLSLILIPQYSYANDKVGLDNPLGSQPGDRDLRNVAGNIIKAVLGIIGSLSILMFFYGGFMWLTAMGKAEQVKKGQQTLFWAGVGIAFIFASYAILRFVFKILDPTFVS